jgi:hypothetical protein
MISHRSHNSIRLEGPTDIDTGALSSGGTCTALLFDDAKDSFLSADGAVDDTVISVHNASLYEAGVDMILIGKADGSYHAGGVCTAVDVNGGTVTIPNALVEEHVEDSRVCARLGVMITLAAYGTPAVGTFDWGYRGSIVDTHGGIDIGIVVRSEIKLVDGGVALNTIIRDTVVGGS